MYRSLVSGAEVFSSQTMIPKKGRTICFTGHREKKIRPYRDNPLFISETLYVLRQMLYRYIDMAVESGYTCFISGLAEGFDLWAAEYVLEKKKINSGICLVGVMPYLGHAKFFSRENLELLRKVEQGADVLITTDDNPDVAYGIGYNRSTDLYRVRNYYMVDNSDAVICYFDRRERRSGTMQTISYANRRGRTIREIVPDDVYAILESYGDEEERIVSGVSELENVFELPF